MKLKMRALLCDAENAKPFCYFPFQTSLNCSRAGSYSELFNEHNHMDDHLYRMQNFNSC